MLIKGEKENINIIIDSEEKAEIMKKLMEMDGVKTIEPEDSHIKVESLSSEEDEEYDPPSKEDRTTFEKPDSGANVPEDEW